MKKEELQRLIKIENKINQIAKEDLGLSYPDVEYDICPPEKFLEIQAYRGPVQISHWSYGKTYDKLKTIYDEVSAALPYEVVINSTPPRAYLLNKNVLAIQALVISHVCGHTHFFTNNKYFQKQRRDIIDLLSFASERFAKYEAIYGIDRVESIIDAALSLQFFSSPYDDETEMMKKKRLFEQRRAEKSPQSFEYSDMFDKTEVAPEMSVVEYNNRYWSYLKSKSPSEPTGDFLRFLIDEAELEDWERDILETLREEGKYYWPIMTTKIMNEGFATIVHQKIMSRLFDLKLIDQSEYGQFIYSNSLVKARSFFSINPYLVGSRIFEDIEERWNKGRFGSEWEACRSLEELEKWDTKTGIGWDKCLEVVTAYNDWFFLQSFLTNKLVEDLELFIYERVKTDNEVKYIRSEHSIEEIRKLIISSYSYSFFPKIEISDASSKDLIMKHSHFGLDLDIRNAVGAMGHLFRLWKKGSIILITKVGKEPINITVSDDSGSATVTTSDKTLKVSL